MNNDEKDREREQERKDQEEIDEIARQLGAKDAEDLRRALDEDDDD